MALSSSSSSWKHFLGLVNGSYISISCHSLPDHRRAVLVPHAHVLVRADRPENDNMGTPRDGVPHDRRDKRI